MKHLVRRLEIEFIKVLVCPNMDDQLFPFLHHVPYALTGNNPSLQPTSLYVPKLKPSQSLQTFVRNWGWIEVINMKKLEHFKHRHNRGFLRFSNIFLYLCSVKPRNYKCCAIYWLREKNWTEVTSSQIIWTSMPASVNLRITLTSFWPFFWAFCMVIMVSPSLVTVVLHSRPSAVFSSNSTPFKKFRHEKSYIFTTKSFYQFKFQNDAFQGCWGHHFPLSAVFSDVHGWSGCHGSFPGEEPNI